MQTLGLRHDATRNRHVAQYNVKATGHVAKLRRDIDV